MCVQLDSEGRKFGKSEGGAVWLDAAKVSPYKFYQHLFATTDADVPRFLRMLTFLDLEEIAEIEAGMAREGYVPNAAQRRLAEEVTRFVHGDAGVQARPPGVGRCISGATHADRARCTTLAAVRRDSTRVHHKCDA